MLCICFRTERQGRLWKEVKMMVSNEARVFLATFNNSASKSVLIAETALIKVEAAEHTRQEHKGGGDFRKFGYTVRVTSRKKGPTFFATRRNAHCPTHPSISSPSIVLPSSYIERPVAEDGALQDSLAAARHR